MGSISSAAALVVADAVDDSVARWKRASPSFAADNTGGVAMLRPFVEGRTPSFVRLVVSRLA